MDLKERIGLRELMDLGELMKNAMLKPGVRVFMIGVKLSIRGSSLASQHPAYTYIRSYDHILYPYMVIEDPAWLAIANTGHSIVARSALYSTK